MVTRKGKAVMPFGVTGGQFQPFGQVEVLTNIIDYGMGIQAAIDAPRIFPLGDTLQVESTVSPAVVAGLLMLCPHVVRAADPLRTAPAVLVDLEAGLPRRRAEWPSVMLGT